MEYAVGRHLRESRYLLHAKPGYHSIKAKNERCTMEMASLGVRFNKQWQA
jgi:hypothetical protein